MACVKICVTGPESSGKSTLTKALSKHFKLPYIKESARNYLDNLGRKHKLEDLTEIAKLQLKAQKFEAQRSEAFFCDTDLLTLKIWAQDKFETELPFIEENYWKEKSDFYLLCYPDLPWEADPLREDENRRFDIYSKYVGILELLEANYVVIKEKGIQRQEFAFAEVNTFLNSSS